MDSEQIPRTSCSSRIPLTLQSVFLAANRGRPVNRPPPGHVASTTFIPRWLLGKRGSCRNMKAAKKIRTVIAAAAKSMPSMNELTSESHHAVQKPCVSLTVEMSSPQAFLDHALEKRGYSTIKYETLQTGYYNKPSKLQQASYDLYLLRLVREGNLEKFADVMACGISPNPCNAYGESLMHTVCRRSNPILLQIMLDNGAETQVSDDKGRTPLHDACWTATPCFEVVRMIIQRDIRLFYMADSRGALPLSYVNPGNRPVWIEWLDANLDTYWPPRNIATLGPEPAPCLTRYLPDGFPLVEPENTLTLGLASLVASGRMRPDEARFLMSDQYEMTSRTEDETDDDDDEDEEDDDESDEEDGEFAWE